MKNQYTALFVYEGDFFPESHLISAVGLKDAEAMAEGIPNPGKIKRHLVAIFDGPQRNLIDPHEEPIP
jgi:hypothetical protein